jgi:predicted TIM-barrel fold metal-dependent hydrolase
LDPTRVIVDAHHHLYNRLGNRYLLEDFLGDVRGAGAIRASVYVQARAMLRADGPEELRSLGETEFANGVAAVAESGARGPVRACAAIVCQADLLLGARVQPVLEAHRAASGGNGSPRVKGIRHIAAWDPDPAMTNPAYATTKDMMRSAPFIEGFAQLAPLGLSFDAWIYFHQIPQLRRLAAAFPDTMIILNHCGGVLGTGRYAGKHDEIFPVWRGNINAIARCPNVRIKLSGLGMPICGFGFDRTERRRSDSELLAAAWRPWMETCIEAFGPERCMFASNFPVDKASCDYGTLWNAFQRIASGASESERDNLFWRSAARTYRLPGFDGA